MHTPPPSRRRRFHGRVRSHGNVGIREAIMWFFARERLDALAVFVPVS